MKTKRYLVTGGAGFIGSAVVRRLVRDGFKVRVLDNGLRGCRGRLKDVSDKIELVSADIRDPRAVRAAVRGVDSVLHFAFLNGTEFFYKRPDLVLDIGVKGMVNIIDSSIAEGVKELVLLSSSEVYQTPPAIPTDEKVGLSIPDPLNPRYSYGAGKIISEIMAVNYGRRYFDRVITIRPHNVYGPDMGWEHVIPQIVVRMKELSSKSKGRVINFPIQGTGLETRAFVFIEDFVDAFMLALKKGEHLKIYNIGTTEEIPIKDVALAAAGYFNKKIEIVPGEPAAGGTARRCPDITRISALGYVPRYRFSEGFRIAAEWYDANFDKRPKAAKRRELDEKLRPFC